MTATGGEVRGLRVKARDTVNRITYTVFTRDGQEQTITVKLRAERKGDDSGKPLAD